MPANKSRRIEYSFRCSFLMIWKIKRRRNANLHKLSQLHVFVFLNCKFETFLMTVKAMCLHMNVAELNTLSVEKGITSTVFYEMENTNENTNLLRLANV